MSEITEGDLVVVYWYDTEDDSSWEKIDLIRSIKAPPAKHAGWFINEDNDVVRIAYSIVDDQAGRSIIPKRSIIKIEKIRDDELEVVL